MDPAPISLLSLTCSERGTRGVIPHASHPLFKRCLADPTRGTNLSSGGPVLGNTANSLALAAGGGLDISLARHFAVRAFEAEYFRTQFPNGANDRQNNLRLSAGLILNWGKD
jgi:hypothetical protein